VRIFLAVELEVYQEERGLKDLQNRCQVMSQQKALLWGGVKNQLIILTELVSDIEQIAWLTSGCDCCSEK
jgi:hypothetical protein